MQRARNVARSVANSTSIFGRADLAGENRGSRNSLPFGISHSQLVYCEQVAFISMATTERA
jgi:hypothetical protein